MEDLYTWIIMHPGVKILHNTGGDIEHIHIGLQHLAKLYTFCKVVAAFGELRAGDAQFDETFGCCLPNGLKYLDDETTAVFPAAAVFIGTVVGQRRQEFGQQPAMTGVDGQNIKACHGAVGGAAAVAADHVVHKLTIHAPDGLVALVVKNIAGANRQYMTGKECGIAALAAVAKLNGGIGSIFMNGGDQIIHGGDSRGVVQNDHGRVVRAGGPMGNGFAHIDKCGAALGTKLVVSDVFRREYAAGAHLSQGGGGGDNTVF